MKVVINSKPTPEDRPEDRYPDLLQVVEAQVRKIGAERVPLFTTDAAGLFDSFLELLPEEARQHYTCHACRRFVDTYGGLVSIWEDGTQEPAIWGEYFETDHIPDFFQDAVEAVRLQVMRAKVTGVFLSKEKTWGTPKTGEWFHLSIKEVPSSLIYESAIKSAGAAIAEKREDMRILNTSLNRYPLEATETAIQILQANAVSRSEKFLGVAEWIADLHYRRNATKDTKKRRNLLWLAVATAPAGFCHISGTMIGTLLEDIVSGMGFDQIKRRFEAKVDPLKYQRPEADPSFGNIQEAERVVKMSGVAKSLERRFARLEEVPAIWKPIEIEETSGSDSEGVFSHLTPKGKTKIKKMEIPPQKITWKKFESEVLPEALEIEYKVTHYPANYAAFTTATNGEAPPILKWDSNDDPNPFSWYLYDSRSTAARLPGNWNLSRGYVRVSAIAKQPNNMQSGFEFMGTGIFFILEGCKDKSYQEAGLALFPEILKSEFHSIRSTLNAFSKNGRLSGYEEASACGLLLQAGQNWQNSFFRVTTKGGTFEYHIDRFD